MIPEYLFARVACARGGSTSFQKPLSLRLAWKKEAVRISQDALEMEAQPCLPTEKLLCQ